MEPQPHLSTAHIIILSITGLAVLSCLSCLLSALQARKKFHKLVPEAEVKLHLAILRLEARHADKVVRNEFNRYS